MCLYLGLPGNCNAQGSATALLNPCGRDREPFRAYGAMTHCYFWHFNFSALEVQYRHIKPIDSQCLLEKVSGYCNAMGDPTSVQVWAEVKSAAICLHMFVFV